ncbi:MAG: hypothetical protein ACK4P5_03905 [Fimbriimonadales bacterium]
MQRHFCRREVRRQGRRRYDATNGVAPALCGLDILVQAFLFGEDADATPVA